MTDAEIQHILQLQMDPLRVKCQVRTYPEYLQIVVSPPDVVQTQKAPLTRVIRKGLEDLDLPNIRKVLLSSRGGQGSQSWETTLSFGDPLRQREPLEETPINTPDLEKEVISPPGFRENVFESRVSDLENEPISPYQILGVSSDATAEEIRKAYLNLVQGLHPDKLPSTTPKHLRVLAEEQFLQVQSAYIQLNQVRENSANDGIDFISSDPTPSNAPTAVTGGRQYTVSGIPPSIVMIPLWQLLLASALSGSAFTLALVSIFNVLFLTPTSVPASESSTDPPIVQPIVGTSIPDPITKDPLLLPSSPSAPLSPEKITQFARALVAVQPLLKATENRLQRASTEAEQKQIREEFDIAARKTIEANGLSTSEYLQISQKALQDPSIGEAVKTATSRLP